MDGLAPGWSVAAVLHAGKKNGKRSGAAPPQLHKTSLLPIVVIRIESLNYTLLTKIDGRVMVTRAYISRHLSAFGPNNYVVTVKTYGEKVFALDVVHKTKDEAVRHLARELGIDTDTVR